MQEVQPQRNMVQHPWYQSWPILGLLSLVVPPLAMVLVWLRPVTGLVKRIAATVPALILTVVYLFVFTDLRLEVDGSGMRPLLSRYDAESHFEALEESRRRQASVASAASVPLSEASEGAVWPAFLGPYRDGHSPASIRTAWPADGLPLLWRQPIGGGYASFVVAAGRAFTIEQRRGEEVVAAYDGETGREVWTHAWEAHFREAMGGNGPRATPTWSEGLLYALGATGELRCLVADTGELVWRRNILQDNQATNLQWAMSGSPLVVGDKVIVLPGGSSGASVAAYDKRTGEPIWQSLEDVQAYTSPMLVTLAGQRQILTVTAERALGLSIADGTLLWDYPWTMFGPPSITQPVLLGDDRVFLSAAQKGAAVFEVTRTHDGFEAGTVWETNRMKTKQSTAILHEGYLYGLDGRILACIDADTGELQWKGGRYGYGQLLLASGHLVVLTESGEVVLVEATPEEHREVARFSAISGKSWTAPVIADGRLLVRNATEMAVFDISG